MKKTSTMLLAGLAAWCGACTAAPTAEAPVAPAPERWARVRPAGEQLTLEAPARVLPGPASTAAVTAPLRATVVKVRARAGDVVAAGAPLLDVLMPEVLEAAGRAEGARGRLEAWRERRTQLAAMQAEGLARSLEVSEATARVAEAQAELQAARAVLLAANVGDPASLLKGAGLLTLRAPMDGVVTQVQAVAGESREPASGALVSLSGGGSTRIEARFNRPPAGATRFDFEGGGARVELALVSTSPSVDARDGASVSWFDAAQPLPAGALGRVVASGAAAPAWAVPAAALQRVEGVSRLSTRRGPVPVEVLRCERADCVVLGPLQEGDEVLVPR